MKIRLGYVAIALDLNEGSPNKTVTYKTLSSLPDDETKLYKLKTLTKQNLETTRRILIYNKAHDIAVYRFTSKLIPLSTHPDVPQWNYMEEYKDLFLSIGNYVKEEELRVSAHPDHFTLINSPKEEVLEASIRELEYHVNVFNAMGLSEAESKLVLHVGGTYGNKELATKRFIENFRRLDKSIQNRIILENDDKSFTAKEVLAICKELTIPMVLDIHHHWCNNEGEEIATLLPEIFNTWHGETLPPKIHASSPKDDKNIRAHADYLDPSFLLEFIDIAKSIDQDFDIMIEAKKKDQALFQLMKELKEVPSLKIIDGATIEA